MSTDAYIDALLHSPRLPEYAALLNQQLSVERPLREKFYEEMTDEVKMEFIAGEVILHSPAKYRHIEISLHLSTLLHIYSGKIGGTVCVEKALCVFPRNDYEPDLVYFSTEKAKQINADTMKFPIPDFIVEIHSESTESRDRGVKFEDYAAHGVKEYWIVDPEKQVLEQYLLGQDGEYELRLKSGDGRVVSQAIPGFAIPIRAIFDAQVNEIARAKLQSPP